MKRCEGEGEGEGRKGDLPFSCSCLICVGRYRSDDRKGGGREAEERKDKQILMM